MRAVLLFVVALALAACDAQGPIRDQLSLSTELDSLTHRDAGVLAFQYALASDDSSTVYLDPDLLNELYLAVGRVRLSEHASLVDGIHASLTLSPYEVEVAANTSAGWPLAWARGATQTGFEPVDALIEQYDLQLVEYYDFTSFGVGQLVSSRPLNTVALSRLFADQPAVVGSNPTQRIRGSRDIEAERVDEGWRLDFTIGEGDCPRGCLSRTYWTFLVSDSGTVEYLGTRER